MSRGRRKRPIAAGAPDERVWRTTIRSDLAEVGNANRALEEFLSSSGLSLELAFSAVLALEEVVTNVIKYGFDENRKQEISIAATIGNDELVLEFVDSGREFDPLAAPPPDFDRCHEEREVGGLGIHILKRIAQRMDYERRRGKNVLTLCFSLVPPK
ncbi:MAG TPA: ATP-binding protein [Planctomycetota bacterium]|nr:ATP-binding protein [Planctomycetota bacterium]